MVLKLKLTEEQFKGLPAELQSEYKKRDDGLYDPDVEGGIDQAEELRTALQSERTIRKRAEDKLLAFGDLDPSVARDAIAKVDEMKDWTPGDDVEAKIAAKLSQVEETWKARVAEGDQKFDRVQSALIKQMRTRAALEALTRHAKDQEAAALLLPHVEKDIRVVEENGSYVARVYDPTGENVLLSRQDGRTTQPMEIDEHVAELKKAGKFAIAFGGVNAAGGGSTDEAGGRAGDSKNADLSKLPPTERLKAFRQREAAGT